MVMPGDNVQLEVELITPVALERASALRSAKAAARWARYGFRDCEVRQ